MEIPTARLYGKDGKKGGKALYITAQVQLTLTLKSKSVAVTVFVQPDSEQECLLGMNVIPLLGIEVRHSDGTLLLPVEDESPKSVVSRLAAENVQAAQSRQKKYYDRLTQQVKLAVGDRVMVYMPSDLQGDEHKLRRPFHGPY